jgi:hypothetical protein
LITLAEIWNAVRTILNVVSQILGIASIIQGQTAKAAQENVPFVIDTHTSATFSAVTDGTIGLAAIKTAIDTLTSNQATEFADIMAAIAGLPQTGDAVTLPGTFPPTWVTGVGDAVWGWPVPTSNNPAYQFITLAGWGAQQRGFPQTNEETPFATALWKVAGVWGEDGVSDPNPNSTFTLDVSTILASDATSADWLNRTLPSVLWFPPLANGCLGIADVDGDNFQWYVDLPIDKWLQLKANLGLTASGATAPIWPGLSGVTLGSPVSLVDGLVITGPLQGVIVSISAAAPGKQKFLYGTVAAYQHIGALSFEDDNSDQESFQALEFENQFYLPKSMLVASSVRFKANAGTTGTVTPFTIP